MGVKVSELIRREELLLSDREALIGFYDEVTDGIDRGELGQEGAPEPLWINDLIEIVDGEPFADSGEGDDHGNYRVTDWILTEDEDLDEFLADWVEVRKSGRKDLQV